ncbi:MAG: hypothetical protein JSR36_00035 [Proteobacteria bacterium]|nr:hypothetical protein [Pseudomonadota bacterium]
MRSEYSGRTSRLPLSRLMVAGVVLLLAACGKSTTLHPGYPVLTMTATNSGYNFASYIVSVNSITLTAKGGGVVYMLPIAQTVDLAKLSDVAELVSAYSVPYGTYLSASLQLTFVSAQVNVNGTPVPASFVTSNGSALSGGTSSVTITFDPAHPLEVALQQATAVNLNFDLMAFNSISSSTTAPVVTVQPYAVLRPSTVAGTPPVRARGQFVTVHDNGSFVMNLRPFFSLSGAGLGAVLVKPTANAYYSINGVSYTGAAGYAALSSIPVLTVVAAYGDITGLAGPDAYTQTNPTMSATEIYVGTSQENGLSIIQGDVSARAGNVVTVHGASVFFACSGTIGYYPTAIVTLGSGTTVRQDGVDNNNLTTAAISVGQDVYFTGNDTPNDGSSNQCTPITDSGGNLLMDASIGSARLLHTQLWGTLNSATATTATFDLLSLGIWPPSKYNFTGTGTPPADPAAYLVSTPTDFSASSPGTLMSIIGGTAAFGAAPPDFIATGATAGSANQETLVVDWPSGEISPFLSASSAGYVVDLSKATLGAILDLYVGPTHTSIRDLPASPLITSAGADQTNLELSVGSTALTTGTSVFATPDSYYTNGVKVALNGTNKLYRLVADGHYNSVSNTFVAERITMALHE